MRIHACLSMLLCIQFSCRVNFQKIIPKSGLFKSSEVFKHLNAEAIKTKDEKDKETKRWTTFLQKPDRPVPKSKAQEELERREALRYRIKICKQPKPKCDPNRPPTPPIQLQQEREATPEQAPEPVPGPEPQYVEYLNEPDMVIETVTSEEISEAIPQEIETNIIEIQSAELTTTKTEEELLIEKQLSDVQKQLLALSTLPLTIQATLDAVTKQLAELMPALRHQQTTVVPVSIEPLAVAEGRQ